MRSILASSTSDHEQTTIKKRTRKDMFLAEMNLVVTWKPLS